MGSVRTILASLFTALGGFFLLALTAGVGFALYLATAPDSASTPAAAEAVSFPPLMKAQAVTIPASNVIRVASASPARSLDTSLPAPDRGARIRQLQKALARAECYNGPISGVWSDASKDAARGFVDSVNAELPVDSPDETLVALIESNGTAKCALGRLLQTGTLGSSLQAYARLADAELPGSKPTPQNFAPQPAMLDRAWAPAGMLVPAKEAAPVVRAPAPDTLRFPVAERTASNNITATDAGSAAPSSSSIHFEGGEPLPAVQPVDPSPAVPQSSIAPHDVPQAKHKKTKTAKRRPAKDDDVTTTIGKNFDSWQRSISSMF